MEKERNLGDERIKKSAEVVSGLDIVDISKRVGFADQTDSKYIAITRDFRDGEKKNVFDYRNPLRLFEVQFTYSNFTMQDFGITVQTVYEYYKHNILNGFIGNPKYIVLMVNHHVLLDTMYKDLIEGAGMNVDMILHYHDTLMASCYRGPVWDNGERPGEFRRNRFPVTKDIEYEVQECLDNLHEASKHSVLDVIVAASEFMLNFVKLRAFAEGNEMLGSFLFNYILMSNNLPPVAFLYDYQSEYTRCANEYYNSGNIYEFVRLIEELTVATWSCDMFKE